MATISIRVSPQELQIIGKALEMYAHCATAYASQPDQHLLTGYPIGKAFAPTDGDVLAAALQAKKIRTDLLGL